MTRGRKQYFGLIAIAALGFASQFRANIFFFVLININNYFKKMSTE
jgi:hypothetical protein